MLCLQLLQSGGGCVRMTTATIFSGSPLPLADANEVDGDHYRRFVPLEKANRKSFSSLASFLLSPTRTGAIYSVIMPLLIQCHWVECS